MQVGEVALDHRQPRHRLAGDRLALPLAPVAHLGLGDLGRGVVLQRHGDDVLQRSRQVLRRQRADLFGDRLEDVPVALRLPAGGHRRLQGVDEGVHVGGGEVVLLVPGRRRQDDVGIERRGVHAEIEVDHQVELPLGRLLPPDRLAHRFLGGLRGDGVGVGAEVVLEEILMPLGARHQGVAAPDEPDPRPVLGGVGILDGEAQLLLPQLGDRPVDDFLLSLRPGFLRLAHQLQGVAVELGKKGSQPRRTARAWWSMVCPPVMASGPSVGLSRASSAVRS